MIRHFFCFTFRVLDDADIPVTNVFYLAALHSILFWFGVNLVLRYRLSPTLLGQHLYEGETLEA